MVSHCSRAPEPNWTCESPGGGRFFASEKPAIVVVAAAKVGGIKANNDFPVEFLLENLHMQNNVIQAAYENGARKLLFLGSSCIYPKHRAAADPGERPVNRPVGADE